jgi:hypothetical protein
MVPEVVMLLLVSAAKPRDIAAPPCRFIPVAAVAAVALLPSALDDAAIGASALVASALLVLESTERTVLLLLLPGSHSEAQVGTQKFKKWGK